MTFSAQQLFDCCGSSTWVQKMLHSLPVPDEATLMATASRCWKECSEDDWREAFSHHPKIGGRTNSKWTAEEQAGVVNSADLITANEQYENKFGYIFIVCATGKTAAEMLSILNERLTNHPTEEIRIAMREQDKITQLRLKKLLQL
jgi:2-oxo-4-hydroxy-4-carboxy-5-ureidoimidazoline decarboxylase